MSQHDLNNIDCDGQSINQSINQSFNQSKLAKKHTYKQKKTTMQFEPQKEIWAFLPNFGNFWVSLENF